MGTVRWPALVLIVFCSACSGSADPVNLPQEVVSFTGPTMGTRYNVSYITTRDEKQQKELQDLVDQRLEEINSQMSTYLTSSELSQFNLYQDTSWVPVSTELAQVVDFALDVARQTEGAFDPTVGPLVDCWGFGKVRRRPEPPEDSDIAQARARVGFQHLEARLNPPALRKSIPELAVDLSAIAKGFAVDEVSSLLVTEGFRHSMVEIGGEIRTRGWKPQNEPWKIGIERPENADRSIQTILHLNNGALASSGDYRNFFMHDGKRYSHTIDPQTGRPVTHQLATVSVLAKSCMQADALATALLVMGDQKGYDWCVREDVAALFLIRQEESGIRQKATPKYQESRQPSEPVPSG